MDKRFFLALLLTGAVVLATPVIFPRQAPPVPTSPVMAPATSPTAPMPAAPLAGTVQPVASTAAAITAAPVTPAETLALGNELTTFRLSTRGATLLSAELPRFRELHTGENPVQLVHGGEPLLRFRLIAGGDTLALDALSFRATRATTPQGEQLVFTGAIGAAPVTISYTLTPANYLANVTVRATGLPQPVFLLTDLPTGFDSQETDSTEDARYLAYAMKPTAGSAERVDFRKPDPGELVLKPGPMTWVVAKSKYFLVGVLAAENAATPFAEVQVTGAPRVNKAAVRAQATIVSALPESGVAFELYAGPQQWERLVAMGREFENVNPYGGWISGVVQPFATIVMRILLWMKRTLNVEYGWILVLFGVMVRVLMWPLNSRMMRSQLAMQRLAPAVQAAQAKHKNDPEAQRVAVMKVYTDAGVSPFAAVSGCLPMLLPMPILFALFFVFQNTIEFRGVSFLWLADISLKDPYYILPLAMAGSMFLLSWISMRSAPPNPQTKMMAVMMPVVMLIALLNFASGLNLYYTVQNLAALPQQWLIARERAKAPQASAVVSGGGDRKKR